MVTDEYVPVGARSFTVASARAFRPGDPVIVRRIGNQDWIDAVGMNTDAPGGRWQPFNIDWDRVVIDVQGNTITVDAPITCAIEKRWGGGEIISTTTPGASRTWASRTCAASRSSIRRSARATTATWTARTTRPRSTTRTRITTTTSSSSTTSRTAGCGIATALHFVTSMVGTQRGSKWITVQDCVSREPISQRRGGRRFIFALRGQLALVQRCQSDKGRHSFMTGQPNGSGNVFLDCKATSPFSSSEPHEQWATGSLYDNIEAPLTARFWKNITIGWAGANTVFWNCKGDFLVQKPPTAQNYAFGHIGVNAVVYNIPLQDTTKENGHIESLDRHVTPRSLYLTQLRERLGDAAVRNIALPSQLS